MEAESVLIKDSNYEAITNIINRTIRNSDNNNNNNNNNNNYYYYYLLSSSSSSNINTNKAKIHDKKGSHLTLNASCAETDTGAFSKFSPSQWTVSLKVIKRNQIVRSYTDSLQNVVSVVRKKIYPPK